MVDSAEAFRDFDPDPASDVEAYPATVFKPARTKLVDALSAVSGVERSALIPWLEESGVRLVVEGLELDAIVDSIEDAWERLVVHNVVPVDAEMPRSWTTFVKSAAHLAMLASDWDNVRAAESLAREYVSSLRALRAHWGRLGDELRWIAADGTVAVGALVDPFWSRELGKQHTAERDALRAHSVAVSRAVVAANNGLQRDDLEEAAAEESTAAMWFEIASRHGFSWTLPARDSLAAARVAVSSLPNITRPLRAIRRLGYGLNAPTEFDAEPRWSLAAPTWAWPPRG
jgi:hypothetical protein